MSARRDLITAWLIPVRLPVPVGTDVSLAQRAAENAGQPYGLGEQGGARLCAPGVGEDGELVHDAHDVALGLQPGTWPTALTPYSYWRVSLARAAESVGLDIGLEDSVEQVNTWIKLIDGA